MGPDGEYIPGTPPQAGTTASPLRQTSDQEGLAMDLNQAARRGENLFPRDGRLPAGMDQRFLTDPTRDIYGNRMPATGGVRGGPGLGSYSVSTGMLPRPQPGFGADRLSMAPGFGGGIGGLFNQLAYMPEENFARSMDRYQQFNDQYGSAMGPRNPMNTMNMFSQFGRMNDDQFNMGMSRYQQYRDMFNQPVRPDPRPMPQPPRPLPLPPGMPVPEVDIFPGNIGHGVPRTTFPPGFDPGSANLDPSGNVLPSTPPSQVGGGGFFDIPGNNSTGTNPLLDQDQMTTTTEYGDVRDQSGNIIRPAIPQPNPYQGNPNQAPKYFDRFGPSRNPYARGYGMGYQPSYQPPYMPQQGPLSYSQGPSKGSPGPGMAYMSPAGQEGYGAFGGGQGYYSPSRPSAPAGGSKGGTGGSSPSGKGGSA